MCAQPRVLAGAGARESGHDNSVLPEGSVLYRCFDQDDNECGCVVPLMGKPTCGNSRKRVRAAHNKENERPAQRRSTRDRKAVQYTEVSDEDSDSDAAHACVAPAADAADEYAVPQCHAHGRSKKKGVALAIQVLQKQVAGLSELKVITEWPMVATVPDCNGVDRANGSARGGDQKGQSSGQFVAGKRHKLDIVLARQDDAGLVALAALEVQGTSHNKIKVNKQDATKAETAGFHVEPVCADACEQEMRAAVGSMLNECKLA